MDYIDFAMTESEAMTVRIALEHYAKETWRDKTSSLDFKKLQCDDIVTIIDRLVKIFAV